MNTLTVWLLISISSGHAYAGPSAVLERFQNVSECERVAQLIRNSREWTAPILRCIQTTIVVVK